MRTKMGACMSSFFKSSRKSKHKHKDNVGRTRSKEVTDDDQIPVAPLNLEIHQKQMKGDQKTTKQSNLKMSELKMHTIDQLAAKLDHSPGVGVTNWKNLAQELIDEKSNLTINNLELHYCGGGNPALEFLRRLFIRNPTITVVEFQNVCRSFKRTDIAECIDSESNKNERLCNIDLTKKEKIANYLNFNTPGVYNWEMFADEYGFNQDDIKEIRSHIKEGQSYSPTKQLFELLRQTRPDMTVEILKQACRKLGRNDIVNILNEVETSFSNIIS